MEEKAPDDPIITIGNAQPLYVIGPSMITIGNFGYDEKGIWREEFISYDVDPRKDKLP